MSRLQDETTLSLKQCCSCSGGLLETDRFCRWCGRAQVSIELLPNASLAIQSCRSVSQSLYETTSLQAGTEVGQAGRPVSGPLMKAVTDGLTNEALNRQTSRLVRGFVLALLSVPLWLMILILSPFDAYFMAKGIANRS